MRLQIGKGGDQLLKGLLPPGTIEAREHEIQEFRTELFKRGTCPRLVPFPGFVTSSSGSARAVSASCWRPLAGRRVKAYLASVGVLCAALRKAHCVLRAASRFTVTPQHLAEAYDTSPWQWGLTAAGQASAQEHGS
jgi:hypothetical protein